ncbi:MAG: A/G-specific adenine glycosylase [Alphaproteobacteria bacterium]|nr:A/G-specific adenine glycosylase [Alphaproteobacteria bacterium]
MGRIVTSKAKKVKKDAAVTAPSPARLLKWYDSHRRILPWRAGRDETPDPYRVWLSEIMLQQTTVAAVGPYFQKFVARWPALNDLAAAPLDDILRLWAGLGYYRRARLLHQCAIKLRDDYGGVFPSDEKTLRGLPGFGPYTAAAVAAIAFGKPANVVDGNVERVMARIFALQTPLPKAKPELRAAAAQLVPKKRAGDYAQALMDLGATICTPRSPKCGLCPWQKECRAFASGDQEKLPKREAKKAKPVRRAIAFVLMNREGEVLLRRRPPHGLLGGMMEVPSTPWREGRMPRLADAKTHAPVAAEWQEIRGIVRHIFTHFTLESAVAVATVSITGARRAHGAWVPIGKLADEALPSVMKKIVHHALKVL